MACALVVTLCPLLTYAVNYGPMLAYTNLFLLRSLKWQIAQLNFARNVLAKTTPEDLRRLDIAFPDLYTGCVSLGQVENVFKANALWHHRLHSCSSGLDSRVTL